MLKKLFSGWVKPNFSNRVLKMLNITNYINHLSIFINPNNFLTKSNIVRVFGLQLVRPLALVLASPNKTLTAITLKNSHLQTSVRVC
jgi:hypothetical protein